MGGSGPMTNTTTVLLRAADPLCYAGPFRNAQLNRFRQMRRGKTGSPSAPVPDQV